MVPRRNSYRMNLTIVFCTQDDRELEVGISPPFLSVLMQIEIIKAFLSNSSLITFKIKFTNYLICF